MLKRTFVLFFCLVQTLALLLFSEQSWASYKQQIHANNFAPFVSVNQEILEELDICPEESSVQTTPMIQANECEWKESLTDLLRHRHASYRFVLFAATPSLFIDLVPDLKFLSKVLKPDSPYLSIPVLPDYYNFLHRFCPF